MSAFPHNDYRLDWERFCAAQSSDLSAELTLLLDATNGSDDDADQCLAAVVRRAASEPAMARLVLRRIMPGIVAIATRRARIERAGFCEILHELVANAWILVCNYPSDRRPRKIAANLIRDVEYLTFVQSRRLRRVVEADDAEVIEQADSRSLSAGEEVIATLAAARRAGAHPDGIRLIGELTLAGRSVQDLASSYGVSPRTILNRRLAAERDLAIHAA